MAQNRKMSHDQNGIKFDVRLRAEGYQFSTAGENIAMGQPTPEAVVQAWMKSPGHRANIQKTGFREVGFGVASADGREYWCADFGTPRSFGFAAGEEEIILSGPLGTEY